MQRMQLLELQGERDKALSPGEGGPVQVQPGMQGHPLAQSQRTPGAGPAAGMLSCSQP